MAVLDDSRPVVYISIEAWLLFKIAMLAVSNTRVKQLGLL